VVFWSAVPVICIHQILEKKYKSKGTAYQSFIYFRKVYDLVKREVLYNILTESCVFIRTVRITKMFINKTYNSLHR
jgi:hypothetical protein